MERRLNEAEAQAVLFELLRRFKPKERPKLVRHVWPFIAGLHAAQRAFHDDPAKLKAALCSGRAGKSTLAAAMLVEACGDTPESNGVYVAPTRGMAKKILWKELKRLNEAWSLGIQFNETDLTATLLNGSSIYLVGANNADQIDKIRGIPIILAVIDEAGMIGGYLEELIEEVISPRLMDFDGSIMMIGTPTAACAGFFFDVTQPNVEARRAGWSVHHWTVLDNPYVPRYPTKEIPNAAAWLERERIRRGWTIDHPVYRREYMGEWVRSSEHLVFPDFQRARNIVLALPKRNDWMWGLGIDVGWSDAVGIVEFAYSLDWPNAYATRSWRFEKISPSTLAGHVKKVTKQRGGALAFVKMDEAGAAAKMMSEELRERHSIPASAAEKAGKPAFIRFMNGDLRAGRLLIVGTQDEKDGKAKGEKGPCASLLAEVPYIQWDPNHLAKGRYIEDPRFPNDVTDGSIYGFRECRHWIVDQEEDADADDRVPEPEPNSKRANDRTVRRHEEEIMRRTAEREARDWYDPFE